MSVWATLWAVVFILILLLYAGLAVVVTIGGFKDVLTMFRRIEAQHDQANRKSKHEIRNTK